MPLNKLDNFIKNTEGRILYVNPNDLESTDSIENQGNSLAKPFKTIQRALIESARFSYLKGNNNDEIEKTTKHDVIAFLTNLAEYIGEDARFIHQGMTSSDILDTTLSIQLRNASDILLNDIKK